jgi:hypothetical protein
MQEASQSQGANLAFFVTARQEPHSNATLDLFWASKDFHFFNVQIKVAAFSRKNSSNNNEKKQQQKS